MPGMQGHNGFKKDECNRLHRQQHLLIRWFIRWFIRRGRQSFFMSKLTPAPVGASENKLAYHQILFII